MFRTKLLNYNTYELARSDFEAQTSLKDCPFSQMDHFGLALAWCLWGSWKFAKLSGPVI